MNSEKWAFQVAEAGSTDSDMIPGVTIGGILSIARSEHVDILKLDSEGAEKELFESERELWLDKIGVIVVELHDRFRTGCSEALYKAARRHGFKWFRRSEHVVLVRQ